MDKKIKVEIMLHLDQDASIENTINDLDNNLVLYTFDHEAIVGSTIDNARDATSYTAVVEELEALKVQFEKVNAMLNRAQRNASWRGSMLIDSEKAEDDYEVIPS